MNNLKYIFLSFFITGFFVACETDFDTTTEWEDITVVYGILDQLDSVYYIKINKAFLGEGNALVYAQEPDSINYPDTLDVKIYELDEDGNTVNTIELIRGYIPEDEQDENDTVFPGGQIIYYGGSDSSFWVDQQKFWLNDNHTYLLSILFPGSSKQVTSETMLVNRFDILDPAWHHEFTFENNPNSTEIFRWEQPENDINNAFRYKIDLIFNYHEITSSNRKIYRSVLLASVTKDQSQVNNEMTYTYHDKNFFVSCLSQIPYPDPAVEDTIVTRGSEFIDFIVSVAAEEFNTFLEVYTPSGNIVQEKPPYTNIQNGIGLFSARYFIKTSNNTHTQTIINLQDIENNILKFEY